MGSMAYDSEGPTQRAIKELRYKYSREQLQIISDCCVCAFTSHGNCGIYKADQFGSARLDNVLSLELIAKVALSQAQAGADIIAPSDMMDNRVQAIKSLLRANHLDIAIMSYSSKFASVFYAPFRSICDSTPDIGHRRDYQLPVQSQSIYINSIHSYI